MTEDIGNSEKLLRRIDRRDKWLKTLAITVLIVLIAFSFVNQIRLSNNQAALKQVIDQNQQTTVQARETNADRQDELKAYIKCIFLAKFDIPAEQLSTREGTVAALDKCAKTP